MELHLTPEQESEVRELSNMTGRGTDELIGEAITGYLEGLAQSRRMLDGRYDDIKSGKVKPINGEEFFENLRRKSADRRSLRP